MTNGGMDGEKEEHLFPDSRNTSLCSHYGNQKVLQKAGNRSTYDPALSLLSI